MLSFREFVNPGAYLNTAVAGMAGQEFGKSLSLPVPTLDIPTRIIETRVRSITYTTNPICICLENGGTWRATKKQWEYLKSIGREPKENSRVQVELFLDGTIKSVDLLD